MRKLKTHELNRLSVEEFKTAPKTPVVIVLDNIRSANNVGSVFRTSDAFAIEMVCLCGVTAQPPNREIQKTAIGATESVVWQYFSDTAEAITFLKEKGYKIISVEQCEGSQSIEETQYQRTENIAFVFGNEVMGVEQNVINLSDFCLEIPQWGTKHSLNISVTVGIVIWDYLYKIKQDSI